MKSILPPIVPVVISLLGAIAFGPSLLAAPAWTTQTSGTAVRLRGVTAVSEKVAWASGSDNTVLRTEDGGATWTKLTPPDETTAARLDFRDIDAIDARTAYLLSIGEGAASRIYKTTDAGEGERPVGLPVGGEIRARHPEVAYCGRSPGRRCVGR